MAEPTDCVLLDAMLGRLARYLRLCGYDAAYALDRGIETDADVRALATREDRLLITRDASLAAQASESVLLESTGITDQLRELAALDFDLTMADHPVRCGRCNGELAPVGAGTETPEYAPNSTEENLWCCVDCGQYFWRGSHWDDVARRLSEL